MSLYFKIPQPDRERLRPLVRLMLQLIFNRLMEQLDPDRHHLLLMLDEFPELKKIPNLSAAMSLMAGYKIKPYLIAQTLTQISGTGYWRKRGREKLTCAGQDDAGKTIFHSLQDTCKFPIFNGFLGRLSLLAFARAHERTACGRL